MGNLLVLIFICVLFLAPDGFAQQTIDPRLLPAGIPRQMQVDGTNLTSNDPVNLQETTEIDPSNPSAGIVQWAIKAASITDAKIAATGITTRSKLPAAICYEDEACSFGGAVSVNGTGSFSIAGSTSGTITIGRSADAGTYNFNLPTGAGTAGQPLLSGGGGAAPMTFGTLGLATGGTNQTTWTASRCVQVNSGGTALESAAAACGTGGGGITLIQGTTNEIGVANGSGPTATISLPNPLNITGKILQGASPLKLEGATSDSFTTTVAVIDPTANRTFTIPNADSVAAQPITCAASQSISAISALGASTCSPMVTGAIPNLQSGTSYTVVDGDRGKLLSFSNTAAVTVTFPNPSGAGFDNGWYAFIQNRAVGVVTLSPTGTTIDGGGSFTLDQNQGILIASDGNSYFTQRGITITPQIPTLAQVTAQGRTDYGANSTTNAFRIGKDANDHIAIGHDPTSGHFVKCVGGGTLNNCNYGPTLSSGKIFSVKNAAGVDVFKVTEAGTTTSLAQKTVSIPVIRGALSTGDGKYYFPIPSTLNGMNLVGVAGHLVTVSSSGAVEVDLARCAVVATGNQCSGTVVDMLTTNLTIDTNENKSSTAATPAAINTANDDVATDQVIRIDVDGAGTGAQDLTVIMYFALPSL